MQKALEMTEALVPEVLLARDLPILSFINKLCIDFSWILQFRSCLYQESLIT